MRKLFILSGMVTVGLIFWTALGYLMDLSSHRIVFLICIVSIIGFFITGFLKKRQDRNSWNPKNRTLKFRKN